MTTDVHMIDDEKKSIWIVMEFRNERLTATIPQWIYQKNGAGNIIETS